MTASTVTSPHVLVIQNSPGSGSGRLDTWLAEDGACLDIVRAFETPVPEVAAGSVDGLIVLGGGLMPDARSEAMAGTRHAMSSALAAGIPTLGICLGGQVLAHVAGGEVRANHGRPEYGSTEITLRAEAGVDPLFGGLPGQFPAIEHHRDVITALPPDVVWLAESATCPHQAFRMGPVAWGLQFHPEIGADRVARWNPADLDPDGPSHDEMVAVARRNEADTIAVCRELARRFAGLVRESASVTTIPVS